MNDEPMWAADHVVAPTPGSAITFPETANEFAINGNHLTLVKGNQFDGRTKTDPHKHIHEFLGICDMFKYRDTENEAIRLIQEDPNNLHLEVVLNLVDYGIRLDDIPIMCDNKGAIDLSKNPVQHSRTKHIEIRHHFLRDNVQKGNISIEKVSSEDNIADILTKPLKREPP
ncbi:hypothetical protein Tco_0652041 [Tanacetum coccineum]|uniref:Copia protein n=1 Tax=Tanacetum coccineum TaxID=301880 RepID=A0ABQ4WWG9_9ASTR